LREARVFRINIAGRWRGFNRNEEGRRELLRIQAYFERSRPPLSACPARLCRTSYVPGQREGCGFLHPNRGAAMHQLAH
jgi:hypothetical protein